MTNAEIIEGVKLLIKERDEARASLASAEANAKSASARANSLAKELNELRKAHDELLTRYNEGTVELLKACSKAAQAESESQAYDAVLQKLGRATGAKDGIAILEVADHVLGVLARLNTQLAVKKAFGEGESDDDQR